MTRLPIPRNTPFWGKQADHLLSAFQEAFDSPLVVKIWKELVQMRQDTRHRQALPDPDVEAIFADVEARLSSLELDLLVCAMCEQSPTLEYALGPHLLRWLRTLLAIDAFDDRWPASWLQRIWHFLPDNPITIAPGGGVPSEELLAATPAHWRQLRDYFKSLRPPQPGQDGGRPLDIEDKASFETLYTEAYQKVLEQKRRDGDKLPNKTEVAAEMLISPRTFKRYRDYWVLPFPPLPPR